MNAPSGAPPPGGLGGGPPPEGGPGYYAPPAGTGSRPAVILWYRVYAIVAALLYTALTFLVLSFDPNGYGITNLAVVAVAALPGAAFFGGGAAIPYKPWGWTYGLVAISLGAFSCLSPLSVVLLIFWTRPNVKAAFRRL